MAGDVVDLFHPVIARGTWFRLSGPDGERHPRPHGRGGHFVVQNGCPVLAIGHRGERLIPWVDLVSKERRAALALLTGLVRGLTSRPSIGARTRGGRTVTALSISDGLERLGFMGEDPIMVLYREFGGELE
jgi:hypothetical protein